MTQAIAIESYQSGPGRNMGRAKVGVGALRLCKVGAVPHVANAQRIF